MTAAEALRRARATMRCGDETPLVPRDCTLVTLEPAVAACERRRTREGKHEAVASALLDGYTVEELTEAGG